MKCFKSVSTLGFLLIGVSVASDIPEPYGEGHPASHNLPPQVNLYDDDSYENISLELIERECREILAWLRNPHANTLGGDDHSASDNSSSDTQ